MSADTLVFDMSSMSEGTPSVFVRKDWLSILDNQNQNYQGNQSVIDTSQLANSNKYMNYREAYLTIPLLLTLTQATGASSAYAPATADGTSSPDYVMGLKNWYGSIVHSFTLDYNGTTIIQQTPYLGLWNTFKLMTSLSYNDIITNGAQLGFYPDDATAVRFDSVGTTGGLGTENNRNAGAFPVVADAFNQFDPYNVGFLRRQQGWNFDPDGIVGTLTTAPTYNTYSGASATGTLTTNSNLNLLWKSYVFNKVNSVITAPATTTGNPAIVQVAITAQVYLKHLASFFERVPLLKGVFMKLTLNLNQSSVAFTTTAGVFSNVAVSSPLGGVSPIMIASAGGSNGAKDLTAGNWIASISVGKTCLNSTQVSQGVSVSPLGGSIILNVPAYTFNPVFETSYLSAPVKKIVYTDIYQYQIVNQISAGQTFNNLITNGIANIKSVLCLPFYQASANAGVSPIQSPFDTAGAGTTSPLCLLTQFNIQVSGQNAIYNTERYAYEQFLNQLQGCNSVNGDMTDGLTSSLIDQKQFEMGYCYYYVNVGRMLPVEEAVPKSVNVLGTNMSSKAIDLFIFIEYGVEVSIDILTGARV